MVSEWAEYCDGCVAHYMVKRVLVTTAIEDTWPKNGDPILFLGEWCRLYGRKNVWQDVDAIVAPYHWDDREKLHADYHYLDALYERLLIDLAAKLNTIHAANHSIRYWRILIGPWLGYFTQMAFDRWSMLKHAIESGEVSKCVVIENEPTTYVPNDFSEFVKLFLEDFWNQAIYANIIELCWADKLEIVKLQAGIGKSHYDFASSCSSNKFKQWVIKLIAKANKHFTRKNDYFFISSYLPLEIDFLLQLKLGQFPKLWRSVAVPEHTLDPSQRLWELDSDKSQRGSFEWVARKFVSQHIPKVYLEGYKPLVGVVHKLPWPQAPKAIFTSVSFSADECFKAWAAEKTENGIPLVIGQHGGHFGMNLFAFYEEHQIKIADRWISWGWQDSTKPHIVPIGNLKSFGRSVAYDPAGGALMVELTMPRQSYHLYAAPIARQLLDYFDEQKRLINALPVAIRKSVLLRLYPQDFGWEQKRRWLDVYPDLQIDEGQQDIRTLIGKSRLYISTYNATTYLESLTWDIPTIMFWNPAHWELNDEAQPYFDLLKSAGLFHETPESAAKQMAAVWDDVEGWWQSPRVQSARQMFCEQYARTPKHPLAELGGLFKALSTKEVAAG